MQQQERSCATVEEKRVRDSLPTTTSSPLPRSAASGARSRQTKRMTPRSAKGLARLSVPGLCTMASAALQSWQGTPPKRHTPSPAERASANIQPHIPPNSSICWASFERIYLVEQRIWGVLVAWADKLQVPHFLFKRHRFAKRTIALDSNLTRGRFYLSASLRSRIV